MDNLDKVKDPFEGEAAVDGAENADTSTVENAENVETSAQKMTRLEAEVAALKTVTVTVQAPEPAKATVQAPPSFTPEQLKEYAKQHNLLDENGEGDIKKLQGIHNIAASMIAPALAQTAALQQELQIEKSVLRAKKEAAASDNQFGKLEVYVDEYLDGVSPADKLDPVKLKAHLERASFYARGKMGTKAPVIARKPLSTIKDETKDETVETAEIFANREGTIKIPYKPLVPAAYRRANADPEIPGAVRINETADWDSMTPKRAAIV